MALWWLLLDSSPRRRLNVLPFLFVQRSLNLNQRGQGQEGGGQNMVFVFVSFCVHEIPVDKTCQRHVTFAGFRLHCRMVKLQVH